MGPSGQGYISDYYLKNNTNGGQKIIKRHGNDGTGAVVSGESEGADHINENPNSTNGGGSNKLSNKKFFKSKIDFMAPIKSLRGPG